MSTATPGSEFWRTEWFPIFQRDFVRYALDSAGGDGEVLAVFLQSPPHEVAYAGLNEMFEALVERFETGAYYWSAADREPKRASDAPPV